MTLPLAAIISEISSIQNQGFIVRAGPVNGGSNSIYEVHSECGKRWCLRIPLDTEAASFSVKGTSILKELKERQPALPVPTVICQSEHYTLMEYIDGDALKSWNIQSLSKERRRVLLNDLAAFLFALWILEMGSPRNTEHSITYREWLQSEVDKGLRRTLNGTATWGDPMNYLYQRIKIRDLVPRQDDGAMAVKHGDLNAWNVIVNETGLSGVVDWDTCRLTPAPSAVQHPLFIADIPGWQNDDAPEGMMFEEDRVYLEEVIGKLDAGPGGSGRIKHLLETSFERQFFEMSLHNRRINDEYVERRFKDIIPNKDVLLAELEDFLSFHELMRDLPIVSNVRHRICQQMQEGFYSSLEYIRYLKDS